MAELSAVLGCLYSGFGALASYSALVFLLPWLEAAEDFEPFSMPIVDLVIIVEAGMALTIFSAGCSVATCS